MIHIYIFFFFFIFFSIVVYHRILNMCYMVGRIFFFFWIFLFSLYSLYRSLRPLIVISHSAPPRPLALGDHESVRCVWSPSLLRG